MEKADLFLTSLFNTFHQGKIDTILPYLPEEKKKALSTYIRVPIQDFHLAMPSFEAQFGQIHYSWLIDVLDSIPKELRCAIASSLSEEQQEGLIRYGYLSAETRIALEAPVVRTFFQNILYDAYPEKNITPKKLLASTALDGLLLLTKAELVLLIDLLAMHDVAAEIRSIVDKKIINSTLDCLSKQQKQFLKVALRAKSKGLITPLRLKEQLKNPKGFSLFLHKRGLLRLAAALSGCEKDFIWYISHTLDKGRGTILLQECKEAEIPQFTTIASTQIIQLLQIFHENTMKEVTSS